MANVDRPNGLTPSRHLSGGTPQRSGGYWIADGLASNIFAGDPVDLTTADREIDLVAAGTGEELLGVFAGCQYTTLAGDVVWSPRWATGTALKTGTRAEAYVYDDPFQEFIIQADGAVVAGDIGLNAPLVFTHAGSAFTGRSGAELDISGAIVGTEQLRILGLARVPGAEFSANAPLRVLINEHRYRDTDGV